MWTPVHLPGAVSCITAERVAGTLPGRLYISLVLCVVLLVNVLQERCVDACTFAWCCVLYYC